MVSNVIGCFLLVTLSSSFRAHKQHQSTAQVGRPTHKTISGVPLLNYHRAYEGEPEFGIQSERQGEWVVMLKPGVDSEQVKSMCAGKCKLVGNNFFEMRGTERDLEDTIMQSSDAIKFIEPDGKVSLIPEVQDAAAGSATWGLTRIGADDRANEGAGVSVYVLDTGVRVSHKEFGKRAAPVLDMTVGNPKECNGARNCARDTHGHGTHCAGTAAGKDHGVAPRASVRAMKVLADSGEGQWSWSYYALDWMATKADRPAVASMSLGNEGIMQGMKTEVDNAVDAGVTVVVAAGNSNSDACFFSPAFVRKAITVGSTNVQDQRSFFSNYGSCVDIWAPGSDIKSASHSSNTGYTRQSGTSMSCPHVSGAAALVLERNPSAKPAAVMKALHDNAVNNSISQLKPDDKNTLLYVAQSGPPPTPAPVVITPAPTAAPTPAPIPCPDPEYAEGPDRFGDCKCKGNLNCWWEMFPGDWLEACPYTQTEITGHYSKKYFLPTCKECSCWGSV